MSPLHRQLKAVLSLCPAGTMVEGLLLQHEEKLTKSHQPICEEHLAPVLLGLESAFLLNTTVSPSDLHLLKELLHNAVSQNTGTLVLSQQL